MAREDLVSSAVTFLQDPSTASAPLEKRIQFLESKNLTQEEIDLALARAGPQPSLSSSSPPPPQNTLYGAPTPQRPPNFYDRRSPAQHGYNPYMDWQPPPPEVPKRDWRDWFIMATVAGGASFALYTLAQRYIKPLIAPPTTPQLEQDKAAVDEQFERAFALLDTLSSDTTALKQAEEARTQRLDTALSEVESVVAQLKAANRQHEDDSRRIGDEIRGIRDSIPRALDSVREGSEKRLQELGKELGSLKLLMGNRFGTHPVPASASGHGLIARQPMADGGAQGVNLNSKQSPPVARSTPATTMPVAAGSGFDAKLRENATRLPSDATRSATSNPWTAYSGLSPAFSPSTSTSATAPKANGGSSGPAGVFGDLNSTNKAAIPAWQMATAAKEQKADGEGGSKAEAAAAAEQSASGSAS